MPGSGRELKPSLQPLPSEGNLNSTTRALRLNVGFLLNASIGYTREFEFDEPRLRFGDFEVERLRGRLRLTRATQGLVLEGELATRTTLECVTCLDEYLQPLSVPFSDLFLFPPPNPTDPLLAVGEDGFLDLEPVLRENLLLEIPIHAVCRPDCKGLCPECGANWNHETCEHQRERIDPRWSALQAYLER